MGGRGFQQLPSEGSSAASKSKEGLRRYPRIATFLYLTYVSLGKVPHYFERLLAETSEPLEVVPW